MERQYSTVYWKPSYTVNKSNKVYKLTKTVADTLTNEEIKSLYSCTQVYIWFEEFEETDETKPYAARIRPLFTNRFGRLRAGVFEALGVIWDERYIQAHPEEYEDSR